MEWKQPMNEKDRKNEANTLTGSYFHSISLAKFTYFYDLQINES